MTEAWTIEVNLNEDVSSTLAWHIDTLDKVLEGNFQKASRGIPSNGWVIIGLAENYEDAHKMCDRLRVILCNILGKEPKGLEEAMQELEKKHKQ